MPFGTMPRPRRREARRELSNRRVESPANGDRFAKHRSGRRFLTVLLVVAAGTGPGCRSNPLQRFARRGEPIRITREGDTPVDGTEAPPTRLDGVAQTAANTNAAPPGTGRERPSGERDDRVAKSRRTGLPKLGRLDASEPAINQVAAIGVSSSGDAGSNVPGSNAVDPDASGVRVAEVPKGFSRDTSAEMATDNASATGSDEPLTPPGIPAGMTRDQYVRIMRAFSDAPDAVRREAHRRLHAAATRQMARRGPTPEPAPALNDVANKYPAATTPPTVEASSTDVSARRTSGVAAKTVGYRSDRTTDTPETSSPAVSSPTERRSPAADVTLKAATPSAPSAANESVPAPVASTAPATPPGDTALPPTLSDLVAEIPIGDRPAAGSMPEQTAEKPPAVDGIYSATPRRRPPSILADDPLPHDLPTVADAPTSPAVPAEPIARVAAVDPPPSAADDHRPKVSDDDLLARLIEKLKVVPEDESASDRTTRLIRLRHLQALAGHSDAASQGIDGLEASEQAYLTHQLKGLSTLVDPAGHPTHRRRLTQAAEHFELAALEAAAAADTLAVDRLSFCTEIESFGRIKPFEGNRFKPGQPVILYCEVDRFSAKKIDGGYETHLAGSYEIFDGDNRRVVSQVLPVDRQTSANRLRDYFIAYQMALPGELTPGTYRLNLIIEDVNGRKYGDAAIPFEIIR